MRKEFFKFGVKLRGKCFVMRDDQSRTIDPADRICQGKCFPGAGDPKERKVFFARRE